MDEQDMRNALLSELIDKMHSRMADKMFPDPDKMDEPAALPTSPEAAEACETATEMPEHGDDEMTEEELDSLMADHVK